MRFSKALVVAALLLNTTLASAAFVVSNPNGGDGFVEGNNQKFTLFGANNGTQNVDFVNLTTYTDTFKKDSELTFDFSYFTQDTDGSNTDKAGFVINDLFTQLSLDDLAQFETVNGSITLSLLAGDVFGFYVDATDGLFGRGVLSVDVTKIKTGDAPSAVPVPAAGWLFLSAFTGFGLLRRKS